MVRKIKYCFYLCLLSGALFAQNAQRIPDELIVQLFKDVSIENVVSKINSDNALQIKINKTLSERLNIYTINFDAEIINAEKIYNIFSHTHLLQMCNSIMLLNSVLFRMILYFISNGICITMAPQEVWKIRI